MEYSKAYKVFGDWANILKDYFESQEFDTLRESTKNEIDGKIVFPEQPAIVFRALREVQMKDLRVIILNNEPFPLPGIVSGLALSIDSLEYTNPMGVKENVTIPQSLIQFRNGMESDIMNGLDLNKNLRYNYSYLCQQGVMLLNCALTVEHKKPGSRIEFWKPFIKKIINAVQQYKNGVIIIAMGEVAQDVCKDLNVFRNNCFYLPVEHPIEGAKRQKENPAAKGWDHQHVFSKTNAIIEINKLGSPINWLPVIK